MNLKKTVILACVLAAAVFYLTKVAEPRRKAELEKERFFSSLNVAAVAQLEGTLQGNDAYAVIRGALDQAPFHSWTLSDIPTAKLDSSKVEAIVTGLQGATFNGPISDSEVGKDFSVFGLDKPELTLVIQRGDGNRSEIAFGKKNEYLNSRYAKVSGRSGLFLVDESTFQALKKSRVDLRAKQPINFKNVDVREATLETSLGRIEISQPAVGEWRVLTPAPRDGSKRDIEQLFNDLQALSADEFIDGGQDRLGEFGLDKPSVTLTVKLRDGLKESLIKVIAGEDAKKSSAYFTYDGSPSVFKVAPEKVVPLRKAILDLREKRLLKFGVKEIEKIVSGGSADAAVEIKATTMDWNVNGKVSDPVFVEQLLNDIAQLSAAEFPKEFPSDAFNQPFLTLAITKKKEHGGATEILTIGKEVNSGTGPMRYARVGEQGEVALIRDVEAKRVIPHEGALIQRATPTPGVIPTAQAANGQR